MRNPGPCESTTCAQLLHPSSFLACSQVTSATRTSLDSVDPTRPRQRTQQPVRHCRSVPRATGSEIQNFLFCPFCSDHSLNRSPTKKKEKTRAFATPPHTPPRRKKKKDRRTRKQLRPHNRSAALPTVAVHSPIPPPAAIKLGLLLELKSFVGSGLEARPAAHRTVVDTSLVCLPLTSKVPPASCCIGSISKPDQDLSYKPLPTF